MVKLRGNWKKGTAQEVKKQFESALRGVGFLSEEANVDGIIAYDFGSSVAIEEVIATQKLTTVMLPFCEYMKIGYSVKME